MKAHCENGRKIAEYLKTHPKVDKIYWPGFTDHPNHEVAKKQMLDFGGMISITLKDADLAETFRVASHLHLRYLRLSGIIGRCGITNQPPGDDDPCLDPQSGTGKSRRGG